MQTAGSNQRREAGGGRATLGLLAVSFIASCAGGFEPARPPEDLQARLLSSDPLHPVFERYLAPNPDMFECLLAIDSFVYPRYDLAVVRTVFEGLCSEARADLEGRQEEKDPEHLASAFLRTLNRREFVYSLVPSRFPGEPDGSVVSYTLLRRRGGCGTFSLLCAAFLGRSGAECRIVCLPDHCLLRVRRGAGWVDIETTDFESPIRNVSSPEPSINDGTHCGRGLSPAQVAWHYFVDRLWCWVPWRMTDGYALQALERAKTILGSTCQALEEQVRRRRTLMTAMGASHGPLVLAEH